MFSVSQVVGAFLGVRRLTVISLDERFCKTTCFLLEFLLVLGGRPELQSQSKPSNPSSTASEMRRAVWEEGLLMSTEEGDVCVGRGGSVA